jgi:hypothetical protein
MQGEAPGRDPAARGRAVVLRIEPLRVSTLTGFHPSRNTARPAAPAVTIKSALPVAEDRGPLMSVAGTRPTVPLDELARGSRTALRSTALRLASCATPVPDRHPGHPPRPEPGRLNSNTRRARAGSTFVPVAALGGTSAAEPPALVIVGGPLAASVAPAELSRLPLVARALDAAVAARCVGSAHRDPPTAPPSSVRGT